MANKTIQLKGRIFLRFNIKAVTGLHIGGSETGIEIGGVENVVIRDPLTNRPYIPGSSLKGKVRSLLEKYLGLPLNRKIGKVYIHSCGKEDREKYPNCDVCQIFGVPGEIEFATPTRLVVRDIRLTDESARILTEQARTDLPYTEVKTEVAIDRVTSAANPRRVERVPAGAVFGPAELVYSVYEGTDDKGNGIADPNKDVERLRILVKGLQLLEDDYLGGLGSRGSGKIKLKDIEVSVRPGEKYLENPQKVGKRDGYDDLAELIGELDDLIQEIKQAFGLA
jgi:CRISPR-associated protein Csm3